MKGKKRTVKSSKTDCRLSKKPRTQDGTHWFDEYYADFGFNDYCSDSDPEISKTTFATFSPNQRPSKKTYPKREWSSSTFTGSVKDIRRITPKISKTSRNINNKIAEIHSEPPLGRNPFIKKKDVKKTGTGSFQFKNQPCIYYGLETIEVLESTVPVEDMRQEKSLSKPEQSPIVTRERSTRSVEKKTSQRTHDKQSDKICNSKISGPTNGLRRSTRYRVPPLDSWRNQRLVFRTLASGEVQCMGIDQGTEADNFGLQQIARKAEKRKLQKKNSEKRKKSLKRVKTNVMNQQTGQLVPQQVHRPLESLQWSAPPNEVEPHAYNFAKTFTSGSTSFGFLDIFPYSEKKEQSSPILNLHFVAIKGHLEVTIQQKKFTFSVGDSWIVPAGVPYSIKNCSRARALVSFSTFKE